MSLSNHSGMAGRIAVAIAATALVAACSSQANRPDLVCPAAAIAPELNIIPQFGPGAGHTPADVQTSGIITAVKTECSRAENGITIHAGIGILARRASLEVKETTLPYFVAVADEKQHVLAKQQFDLKVEFVGADTYRTFTDDITVHLPVKSTAAGGDYVVIVGFQLTPEERDFARTHPQQ